MTTGTTGTTFLGADPDQLDQLAAHFTAMAQQLTADRSALAGQLGQAPWTGKGADAFRSAFAHQLAPHMSAAASFLIQSGKDLKVQAQQQRDASADTPSAKEESLTDRIIESLKGGVETVEKTAEGIAKVLSSGEFNTWIEQRLAKLGLDSAGLAKKLGVLSEGLEKAGKALKVLGLGATFTQAFTKEYEKDAGLPDDVRVARATGAAAAATGLDAANGAISTRVGALGMLIPVPGVDVAASVALGLATDSALKWAEHLPIMGGGSLEERIKDWGAEGGEGVLSIGKSIASGLQDPSPGPGTAWPGALSIGSRAWYDMRAM